MNLRSTLFKSDMLYRNSQYVNDFSVALYRARLGRTWPSGTILAKTYHLPRHLLAAVAVGYDPSYQKVLRNKPRRVLSRAAAR